MMASPLGRLMIMVNVPFMIGASWSIWVVVWVGCVRRISDGRCAYRNGGKHMADYPDIARLARRRLCVQASSATSERALSKAGLNDTKSRMSLLLL